MADDLANAGVSVPLSLVDDRDKVEGRIRIHHGARSKPELRRRLSAVSKILKDKYPRAKLVRDEPERAFIDVRKYTG